MFGAFIYHISFRQIIAQKITIPSEPDFISQNSYKIYFIHFN